MTRREYIITVAALVTMGVAYVALTDARPPAAAAVAPQTKPQFCTQMREEAERDCGVEMENSFMDEGGDNYTRGVHLKDASMCRRIGEAVSLACNNYGKE